MFELGLDGCRVRADRYLAVNASAGVEVTFKIKGIGFRLAGTMEWLDPRQTVAIRFSPMAPRRRETLESLLDELEAQKQSEEQAEKLAHAAGNTARSAARLSPATSERPATGTARILPMPTGLHGDRSPSIAPPPATPHYVHPALPISTPDSTADKPVNKPADGEKRTARLIVRERREQARHAVDTRATVFFIDVGAKISGRILDLSMCGCRIRADERFPVGIYRRVETEFKLDGMPFRLSGVVQAVHDKFTVGIRFVDMSARKGKQLQELMQEIAEMKEAGTRDQRLGTRD